MLVIAWVALASGCGGTHRDFENDAGTSGTPRSAAAGNSGADSVGGSSGGSVLVADAGHATGPPGDTGDPSGESARGGASGGPGSADGGSATAGATQGAAGSTAGDPSTIAGAAGTNEAAAGQAELGGRGGTDHAGAGQTELGGMGGTRHGIAGQTQRAGSGGADEGNEGGAAGNASPFVCGDPLPAAVPPTVLESSSTPDAPAGGVITEGMYVHSDVTMYGSYSSVPWDGLEVRDGYVHRRHVTYTPSGSALTGYEEIGQYAVAGTAMAVDSEVCNLSASGVSLWRFTATPTQFKLFSSELPTSWIETFTLQQ